jgi:hypothetical protein
VSKAILVRGSACGPVIVPVFKTGGRQVFLSPVGSTPTRFRHFSTISCIAFQILWRSKAKIRSFALDLSLPLR